MAAFLGLPAVEEHNGLNIKNMTLNNAYMVMNTLVDNVGVYVLRDDCFNCPFKIEQRPPVGAETSWLFDTSVRSTWRLMNRNQPDELATNDRSGLLCEMRPTLGEFGVYRVRIGRCDAKEELAPVNSYTPLLLLLTIFLATYFIYGFIKFAKWKKITSDIVIKSDCEKEVKSDSLQVLRGLLITLLIFVTSGGGGYPLFNAEWGGITTADVIFFLYTWTVGVYIPIFVENTRVRGGSKWCMIKEMFLRGIILLLLGTVIDSTVQPTARVSLWRPLQRLGLAYFITGTAYVLTVQKFVVKSQKLISKMVENLVSLLWCWILSGFLLAIIIILISTFASFNCVANIDLKDVSIDHSGILSNTTDTCNNGLTESANIIFVANAKKMINVNNYTGFSAGLLGVMSTIMTTMIGLKSGHVFVRHAAAGARAQLWLCWAAVFLLSGGGFAWATYPLKFNLQPISTIVLIPTLGMYLLILTYSTTEMLSLPKAFETTGLSSIAILTGHLLFSKAIPFVWNIELNSHVVYITQNLWTVALWTVIGFVLVRKNIKIYL